VVYVGGEARLGEVELLQFVASALEFPALAEIGETNIIQHCGTDDTHEAGRGQEESTKCERGSLPGFEG